MLQENSLIVMTSRGIPFFSFVALLRNKDKLTISYSLGTVVVVKRDVAGWRRLLLLTGRLTLLLQWQKQVNIKSREHFYVIYISTTYYYSD